PGWEQDTLRYCPREATRRLRHPQVIADGHANRTQIRRGKNRERTAPLAHARLRPGRANLVVAANFPASAAEQEGGVVGRAVSLGEVTANDEIHFMPSSGGAEAFAHPLHRLW